MKTQNETLIKMARKFVGMQFDGLTDLEKQLARILIMEEVLSRSNDTDELKLVK